jgi:hypothetical protein
MYRPHGGDIRFKELGSGDDVVLQSSRARQVSAEEALQAAPQDEATTRPVDPQRSTSAVPSSQRPRRARYRQVQAVFAKMQLPEAVRDWFDRTLRQWSLGQQKAVRDRTEEVQRQLALLRGQQDRLLNLRLNDEINAETYASKDRELQDRIAEHALRLEAAQGSRDEHADLAVKVFELSQGLAERWLTADYSAKRRILEIVCLNFRLDGVTLVMEMRKPFDVLVEGASCLNKSG